MPRLTLRTLLAYLDDTLNPDEARSLGQKVAESPEAQHLIERIKRVTRRRGLTTPPTTGEDADVGDPNTVAEYLSDNLKGPQVRDVEETCLTSDVHLAEVAACHQILTLVLTEPVRVPPSANKRMYLLVDPPASDLNRKPSTALPVGGLAPPGIDNHEADDSDAALLLGMKRYSASESWAGRIGLVIAVGAVAAVLVLAVLMSLPHAPGDRPETTTAALPKVSPEAPDIAIEPPKNKEKKPVVPDSGSTGKKDGKAEPVIDRKKDEGATAKSGEVVAPKPKDTKIQPPLLGDDVVGELDTKSALVLTRTGKNAADWVRIDPTMAAIRASRPIMALPGYKADVKLNTGVRVQLWGNVPEQIAMPQMVMQSRVQFHPPATGFDADITIVSGRVYVTPLKPTGAKVRFRLGNEVWDVKLRDNKCEVLAQLHTAFIPGTRIGERPKSEATLAVVSGTADFQAPARFKSFEGLAAGQEVTWDSESGRMSEKHPIPPELYSSRDPALPPEIAKALDKVLADAAKNVTSPDGVPIMLKERLTKPLPEDLKGPPGPLQAIAIAFPTQFAAYSYAAMMDGPDSGDLLKDQIDALGDANRPYARQATVMALSAWVAQSMANTDLLIKGMIAKGWRDDDSELIARLLRGYSSFEADNPKAVDDLVEYLDHPQLAVREVALGNLLAFFDPDAIQVPDLRLDVARRREPGSEKAYEKFLTAWKARAAEIKQKMGEKK